MNNFLALQREDIEEFSRHRQEIVRERVEKQLATAEFVGDLIELFLPVMADTLTVMSGGQPGSGVDNYLTIEEMDDDDPYGGTDDLDEPPAGPTPRNEIIR